jgi:tight adherence protein B
MTAALVGRALGPARRPIPRRAGPRASATERRRWSERAAGVVRRGRDPIARRRGPGEVAVATWCDELGRRLRAGSTLRDALLSSDTTDRALRDVIGLVQLRLERGGTVEEALASGLGGHRRRRWPDGPTNGDDVATGPLAVAFAVIATAAALGGPGAQALDRAATALRLREADRQERAAHSAQARMSAHVLTLVPLGFLVLMVTLDPEVRSAIATPAGAALVAAGLALNGLGWLWMRIVIGGQR